MPDAGPERGLDGRTAVAREGRMVATVWEHVYGLGEFEEKAGTMENPDLNPGLNCNCLVIQVKEQIGLSSARAVGCGNGY